MTNKNTSSSKKRGPQVQIQAEQITPGHRIADSAEDKINHLIKIAELGRCPKGIKTKW